MTATGWRSGLRRYGFAVAAYILVVGLQTLLLYYSIKISFTVPIVVALFAVSWYAGRRPGLLIAILFEATTVYSNPIPCIDAISYTGPLAVNKNMALFYVPIGFSS